MAEGTTIECGREAAKCFALASGYRNLNHGSYGTYPLQIREKLRELQARIEARPDAFTRYEYRTHLLDESRHAIEQYLHAPKNTCVFVPNATHGIDTVLRNLDFHEGDVVIGFATMYDAFANTLKYLSRGTRFKVDIIEYTLPVPDDLLCDLLDAAIKSAKTAGLKPRLALFDTINALPGVRMPFERLTEICRAHNVLSCIDGAHGIGQIPLDLQKLNPDFFVTNCHKWFYVPRGCGILYVPVHNQYLLPSTLPTSYRFGESFIENHAYIGTLDDSPYLCVPTALRWRASLTWSGLKGEDAAMSYGLDLARKGGETVATMLGTDVLENQERSLGNCAFTNVRLPVEVSQCSQDAQDAKDITAWIMKTMILQRDTPVFVFLYADAWWARLSAPVYISLDDFEVAGLHLQDLCGKVTDGSWRSSSSNCLGNPS